METFVNRSDAFQNKFTFSALEARSAQTQQHEAICQQQIKEVITF